MNIIECKRKLKAFFDTATTKEISALLKRTNYNFYKTVVEPKPIENQNTDDSIH